MPSLSVSVPHQLTEEEAARRLRERYAAIKTAYGQQIKDLEEVWNGNSLQCRFSTFGMKVQSTVTSEPGQVLVRLDLPLLAMAFKGVIEQKVREELSGVLA